MCSWLEHVVANHSVVAVMCLARLRYADSEKSKQTGGVRDTATRSMTHQLPRCVFSEVFETNAVADQCSLGKLTDVGAGMRRRMLEDVRGWLRWQSDSPQPSESAS
uniref:DUF305 domain-containing protein n=1 Tax=Mesocestoides corti TaxID=53468 RepID=A0A5K3EWP8_MESCO